MPAIIAADVVDALNSSVSTVFNAALRAAAPSSAQIATRVPSTSSRNAYAWLGKSPALREWLGDRVVESLAQHAYVLENRDWETSVVVDRNDIEDDNLGVYRPLFEELGEAAAHLMDDLCWSALAQGRTGKGYDGKTFFATDHPVTDKAGKKTSVSNWGGGSGDVWYVLATKRAVRPILYQERKAPQLTRKDDASDDNVFYRREFVYGVEARAAAGYGAWQTAYASGQELNANAFDAACMAMLATRADGGRPIGMLPDLLVVPPALRAKAMAIVKADRLADGASNTNHDAVTLHIEPRLAS